VVRVNRIRKLKIRQNMNYVEELQQDISTNSGKKDNIREVRPPISFFYSAVTRRILV